VNGYPLKASLWFSRETLRDLSCNRNGRELHDRDNWAVAAGLERFEPPTAVAYDPG
jgi:hypothetical protein